MTSEGTSWLSRVGLKGLMLGGLAFALAYFAAGAYASFGAGLAALGAIVYATSFLNAHMNLSDTGGPRVRRLGKSGVVRFVLAAALGATSFALGGREAVIAFLATFAVVLATLVVWEVPAMKRTFNRQRLTS